MTWVRNGRACGRSGDRLFAKLAAVYFVCLFGFVIWVGFAISWLFFAGVKPPLVS